MFAHVLVGLEQREEIAAGLPHFHGVALHQPIGVLTGDAFLGERQQHPLGMNEAAETVEILAHVFRVNDQLVDHAGEPAEREIERHRRIRADHALDRGMGNVALVPQRHVFERRRDVGAHHAGEADEIFRQHRIALVRHRRGAFLPRGEIFLGLQHFGALQMADFRRQPLDGRRDDAQRGKIHGVAVARNDLRRDRLDLEPHFARDMGFDPRIDLGESTDGAGNRAGRDLGARRDQALFGAGKLGIGDGDFQPERGRLGMNAVGAADGRRELVFAGAAFERGEERLDVGDQKIGGEHQLHVEAGVEHVGRRHALVHETRLGADDFSEVRQERDDVVLGLALDLVDAVDIELRRLALGPDLLRRGLRDHAELGHGIGGMGLDLEPDAKPRLRRPDRRHLRAGVARDGHATSPRASAAALRIAAMLAR